MYTKLISLIIIAAITITMSLTADAMPRTPVISSNLASVGYEKSTHILEIEFHNKGSVYRYFDVPEDIYHGLMEAPSHGKYFDRYIKKGGYKYERIK